MKALNSALLYTILFGCNAIRSRATDGFGRFGRLPNLHTSLTASPVLQMLKVETSGEKLAGDHKES
jgi:hypothetical protein